jgi:hypothetical protein
MNPTKETPNFSKLFEKWPSPFVARTEVSRFSGGILNSKTCANNDSKGTGPAGRVKIGRKIAYEKNALVEWLQNRATRLN